MSSNLEVLTRCCMRAPKAAWSLSRAPRGTTVLQYLTTMMASTRVRSRMELGLTWAAASRTFAPIVRVGRRTPLVFSCLLLLFWGHALAGQSPVAPLDDSAVAEVIQEAGARWAPLELSDKGDCSPVPDEVTGSLSTRRRVGSHTWLLKQRWPVVHCHWLRLT